MAKLRSVSTSFWSDPFVEDLTPTQKLLFLYLITNEKTNMLGVYESSIRKISFETGIKKDEVSNALKAFERVGKVKMFGNYVVLVNYMKHQNYNTNMKKSAIDVYNSLPNELKDSKLSIDKSNPLEGFERLLNHYGMVRKVEVEYEDEVEDEIEVKDSVFSFESFYNLYAKKVGPVNAEKKWNNLTESEKELVMLHVPNYVRSTPDKKYRKNPEAYLNQKHWLSEIDITPKQTEQEIFEL